MSTLLALRHAERTGVGQRIDCSLLDTQIAMLANQALSWLVGGELPGRLGNAHPTVVPYRPFETADGPLVIAVGNDGQFRGLCAALGVPDLAKDARYVTNAARVQNRDSLEATLQSLVEVLALADLTRRVTAAGVPSGPVNTIQQIFDDPFVEARKTVHYFLREDGVRLPSVAFPGKLSETPAEFRARPPFLGEHTYEVLGEWLGLCETIWPASVRTASSPPGRLAATRNPSRKQARFIHALVVITGPRPARVDRRYLSTIAISQMDQAL